MLTHSAIQQHLLNQPLTNLSFLGSHNTFTGALQLFTPASSAYLKDALQRGFRVVELNVWSVNDMPVVTRHPRWQKPYPFEEAMRVIAEYAFRDSDYPLFLFIQDMTSEQVSIHQKMAHSCHVHLDEYLCKHRYIHKAFLSEVLRSVIIISSNHMTLSRIWNDCLTGGISFSGKRAVKNARMDESILKTVEPSNPIHQPLVHVYPETYLLSTHAQYKRWYGIANFVCINTGPFWSRSLRGTVTTIH